MTIQDYVLFLSLVVNFDFDILKDHIENNRRNNPKITGESLLDYSDIVVYMQQVN